MSDLRISFADPAETDAAVEKAVAILRREGVVVLDDLVDPTLIAQCRNEIEARYPHLAEIDRERNYGPYPGRHTMPMTVENTLADRAIFLPRTVERIAVALLGPNFLMDSVGLLVSLPGADDQARHSDGRLFPEAQFEGLLPCFALAFSMPLVPMDAVSGTTAFCRGSHRAAPRATEDDFAPIVLPGSAILWDFRTLHRGLANRGASPRPVVYSVFSRHWWVEIHPPKARLYEKFLIARAVYDVLKPRLQRRVSRATLIDGRGKVAAHTVGQAEI